MWDHLGLCSCLYMNSIQALNVDSNVGHEGVHLFTTHSNAWFTMLVIASGARTFFHSPPCPVVFWPSPSARDPRMS
ncbi:uncharacterized protein BJ212DRAFT_1319765 [Suillus subaureus]|uniref:Uncharacterized protein n=1 Tax=Suillus subaureus TaxID=48587 RepID=A0A9P7ELB6_9AGAM|nr:uncharacterized protein BJ212DRAFT_1319765 [Suillus subaureus]KAG1824380.1 hypothetical protein BJ212DRAFT_1319765 [Suillus subaureus]